jgi:hypothetical protein
MNTLNCKVTFNPHRAKDNPPHVIGGDNEYGVIPTKADILKKLDKLSWAAMGLPYGIRCIMSHEVENKEFMDKFNTKVFAPASSRLSSEMRPLCWFSAKDIEKTNRLLLGRASGGYDIVALKLDAGDAGQLTIGFAKNPSNGTNIDHDVIEAISGFSKLYKDVK